MRTSRPGTTDPGGAGITRITRPSLSRTITGPRHRCSDRNPPRTPRPPPVAARHRGQRPREGPQGKRPGQENPEPGHDHPQVRTDRGAGRLGVAARGGASARSASGGRRGRGEAQHGDGAERWRGFQEGSGARTAPRADCAGAPERCSSTESEARLLQARASARGLRREHNPPSDARVCGCSRSPSAPRGRRHPKGAGAPRAPAVRPGAPQLARSHPGGAEGHADGDGGHFHVDPHGQHQTNAIRERKRVKVEPRVVTPEQEGWP